MTKKKSITTILKEYQITLEQESFCQHFVSPGEFYGNGTQAYIFAYNIDTSVRGQYNAARANASRLLTLDNINKRINDLIETGGFNTEHMDKRLLHWANQNEDGNSSIRAIQEFNKLKQRITEHVEHEIKVPVTSIIINPISNGKKDTDKKE
jgi:signal transduction histidine kinase